MSGWIGPAVVLFMIAGIAFMTLLEIQAMRRNRRWTRADAIVCADPEHLALKPSRQPRVSETVMFERPAGPCVAWLYTGHPNRRPIGMIIAIAYNPDDPSQVQLFHGVEEHWLRLASLGCGLGLILFGLWRMLTMA
ncbi:DUF3592 domain-containing protein [Roseomonas stagni]|uniref:DUF3592 domain-containing protein n=1 Tax=Falsiroseomonas algicola TaxID=2716930 RepID=A0A6M1LT05_9PROT|nr:DUF3592 domain-containing protein [Falsiroseomonas algicola]NGM22724.1 DUF3592 domain-containing protein [Falsiroseomonas algicola]